MKLNLQDPRFPPRAAEPTLPNSTGASSDFMSETVARLQAEAASLKHTIAILTTEMGILRPKTSELKPATDLKVEVEVALLKHTLKVVVEEVRALRSTNENPKDTARLTVEVASLKDIVTKLASEKETLRLKTEELKDAKDFDAEVAVLKKTIAGLVGETDTPRSPAKKPKVVDRRKMGLALLNSKITNPVTESKTVHSTAKKLDAKTTPLEDTVAGVVHRTTRVHIVKEKPKVLPDAKVELTLTKNSLIGSRRISESLSWAYERQKAIKAQQDLFFRAPLVWAHQVLASNDSEGPPAGVPGSPFTEMAECVAKLVRDEKALARLVIEKDRVLKSDRQLDAISQKARKTKIGVVGSADGTYDFQAKA